MAAKRKAGKKTSARIQLVESDDKAPTIQARPGTRLEVVAISTHEGKPSRIGARLCGYGSGYCLAIVEV